MVAFRRGIRVRKEDRLRALVDIQTLGLIYFRAPFSSGLRCRIPRGAILRVYDVPSRFTFLCTPADRILEEQIVPAADLLNEKYAGVAFSFGLGEIGRRFEIVDTTVP